MKKVVNININGIKFTINEDAYLVLSIYLEKLNNHFESSAEGREIMDDIEARIAEIFKSKIDEGKQVLDNEDVRETIEIMGNIDEIADEEEKETHASIRKLYRDTEDHKIAGVCSGLSYYLKIDVTLIRILVFVLFFISMGTIAIAYILGIVFIPEAKTISQKMEMKGERINISNIEKNVKDTFDDIKDRVKHTYKNNNVKWQKIAQFIGKLIGFGFVLGGIGMIISLLIGWKSNYLFNEVCGIEDLRFSELLQIISLQDSYFLSIGIALILFIVLFSLFYIGTLLIFSKRTSKVLNIFLTILFLISITLMISGGFFISSNFYFSNSKTDEIALSDKKYECITIKSKSIFNETDDFKNEYHISRNNDDELIFFGDIDMDIMKSENQTFSMDILKTSRGKTKKEAKEYIRHIDYSYSFNDSCLQLDEQFIIDDYTALRAQKTQIILYVPIGQKIIIDRSLKEILDDVYDIDYRQKRSLYNNEYIMTRDGLVYDVD